MNKISIDAVMDQIRKGEAKCYLTPSKLKINQAKLRLTIENNLSSLHNAKFGTSFADVIKDTGKPIEESKE